MLQQIRHGKRITQKTLSNDEGQMTIRATGATLRHELDDGVTTVVTTISREQLVDMLTAIDRIHQ